jgi:hypothetical protein
VVLVGAGDDTQVHEDATRELRARIAAGRDKPELIDRGPGYETLRNQTRGVVLSAEE